MLQQNAVTKRVARHRIGNHRGQERWSGENFGRILVDKGRE